jgi:hypothetical protein
MSHAVKKNHQRYQEEALLVFFLQNTEFKDYNSNASSKTSVLFLRH